MEFKNKAQLLEFIKKESLKLFVENQAFSTIESTLQDVDDGFVSVNEKRYERLKAEEEKAKAKEEYVELQNIKKQQVDVIGKLIASYKKKIELLDQIRDGLRQELDDLGVKGNGVFKDNPVNEFNNEDYQKGHKIRVQTNTAELTLEKISENNQYKILGTNAPGLQPGDVIALPSMKVGGTAEITVYRNISGKFQEIGKTKLNLIKSITKNPS